MNTIEISIKKLYQYIITALRYAYTRNNHLEPSSEYKDTLEALQKMRDIDREFTLSTIRQIIEECISLELDKFEDGVDDLYNNLKNTFEFLQDLFNLLKDLNDDSYTPYNIHKYIEIYSKYSDKKYDLFETEYIMGDESAINYNKTSVIKTGTLKELEDYLFIESIKREDEYDKVVYRKINVIDNTKTVGYQYDICLPVKYSGKTYLIKLHNEVEND